mmetsp:Transcript_80468/g.232508  ORF Transcript_80468/g.232508 Transcript_80468/m.232508 type:complete len:242 (+) Transcript_80468:2076-2801(+)
MVCTCATRPSEITLTSNNASSPRENNAASKCRPEGAADSAVGAPTAFANDCWIARMKEARHAARSFECPTQTFLVFQEASMLRMALIMLRIIDGGAVKENNAAHKSLISSSDLACGANGTNCSSTLRTFVPSPAGWASVPPWVSFAYWDHASITKLKSSQDATAPDKAISSNIAHTAMGHSFRGRGPMHCLTVHANTSNTPFGKFPLLRLQTSFKPRCKNSMPSESIPMRTGGIRNNGILS